MPLPQWFSLYCDILGVPLSQRNKKYDHMKKKAGRIGERFAREEWSLKGYKVIPKDQRKGGYDYLFVKREPYYSQNLPNQIYAEIKVNTSKQTRHQKEIEYEIINNGGTYWVTRYTVPLILADDMAG